MRKAPARETALLAPQSVTVTVALAVLFPECANCIHERAIARLESRADGRNVDAVSDQIAERVRQILVSQNQRADD